MFTTILVTGGAGYEVIVADNLSNSKCKTLSRINEITGKEITFYKVDIRDRENSEKIFAENIIDAVIHFAGLKAVTNLFKSLFIITTIIYLVPLFFLK